MANGVPVQIQQSAIALFPRTITSMPVVIVAGSGGTVPTEGQLWPRGNP